MTSTDIQTTLASLGPWYHAVTVGDYVTPGKVDPEERIQLALDTFPEDLTGCTVLDVGGNCGSVALALARRGAQATVVEPGGNYRKQGRALAEHFGLDVTFRKGDVYDVRNLGTFDYVVFYGLIYHLRHPLLALDIMRAATRKQLVLSSRVNQSTSKNWALGNVGGQVPSLDREAAHNWWLPSVTGMEESMRVYGFTDVRTLLVDEERNEGFWSGVPDPAIGAVRYAAPPAPSRAAAAPRPRSVLQRVLGKARSLTP
jgi:SAM-dependent methyltransferase